jgi:hypothetical protein
MSVSHGALEHWRAGVLEYRNVGILEGWNVEKSRTNWLDSFFFFTHYSIIPLFR